MIWVCVEIATILVECAMFSGFLVKYFSYKNQSLQHLKTFFLFLWLSAIDCIGTFYISFDKRELFLIFSIVLSEIVFAIAALKGKFTERIFICLVSYVLVYFSTLPTIFFVTSISNVTVSEFVDNGRNAERIISLFTSKTIYFIFMQALLAIKRKREYQLKKEEWYIVVSTFIITLALNFGMDTIMVQYGMKVNESIMLMFSIMLCALNFLIFVFVQRLSASNIKENEQKILLLQMQYKQDEMKHLERQYREIAIMKHDFKKQINTIQELLQQGKIQDVSDYVAALGDRSVQQIQQSIQCNSSIVNAVVNTKFNDAKKMQIKVSCRMISTVPKYLECDLGILLSNLLDNAIEACENQNNKTREIIVSFSEVGGYYRIIVKNMIEQSVLKHNKNLKTSKNDHITHGWGLKSVGDIVKSYNGLLDFYEKDSFFIVNIMLPIKDGQ